MQLCLIITTNNAVWKVGDVKGYVGPFKKSVFKLTLQHYLKNRNIIYCGKNIGVAAVMRLIPHWAIVLNLRLFHKYAYIHAYLYTEII